MALRKYRNHLVAALGLALACDPRYSIETTVTLPDEVAAAYTPTQRGLVVVSISTEVNGPEVFVAGVVCGEGELYGASASGFGERPAAEVQAWIEPLPADDERPCGKFVVPKIANQLYVLDADEPQAQASSEAFEGGCGDSESASATITIDLTIAAP